MKKTKKLYVYSGASEISNHNSTLEALSSPSITRCEVDENLTISGLTNQTKIYLTPTKKTEHGKISSSMTIGLFTIKPQSNEVEELIQLPNGRNRLIKMSDTLRTITLEDKENTEEITETELKLALKAITDMAEIYKTNAWEKYKIEVSEEGEEVLHSNNQLIYFDKERQLLPTTTLNLLTINNPTNNPTSISVHGSANQEDFNRVGTYLENPIFNTLKPNHCA